MPPVIEARGLTKRYATLTAVDAVDFTIDAGECYGFLGPNGAGKTSTVKMIHCSSPITVGDLRVFGLDVREQPRSIKQRIGVCQQEDTLDPDFSVRKNLTVFGRYFGIPARQAGERSRELLEFMGLWERRDARIRELSGGLKRRLAIARALVNEPDLLILDEPTTGLDPQSRHQVWDRVRTLRRQGKTILLTTHYMDEAQTLCDRLVIMDHGRILVEGPPADLVRTRVGREVVEVWGFPPALVAHVKEQGWSFESDTHRLWIYTDSGEDVFEAIARKFPSEGCTVRMAGLEDLFLKLTGRELRE
ncbi:MAG: ABC transporter [Acidobacteria bacterium 13_1_40CM_2_68_5]|nr:MAG: ABC transporter [Acidobacteria bacterium 13_1_40CM_2_68_5]OLE66129.1 MAG: ABC transporter [Acidobacteria bacterium 13_1_20CM_2_68_14]